MKYMLLMYANESVVLETPEDQEAVAQTVWFALMKEMKDKVNSESLRWEVKKKISESVNEVKEGSKK